MISLRNQVRDLQDRVSILERKLEAFLVHRRQDGDDWSVVSSVPPVVQEPAGSSASQNYNELALEIPIAVQQKACGFARVFEEEGYLARNERNELGLLDIGQGLYFKEGLQSRDPLYPSIWPTLSTWSFVLRATVVLCFVTEPQTIVPWLVTSQGPHCPTGSLQRQRLGLTAWVQTSLSPQRSSNGSRRDFVFEQRSLRALPDSLASRPLHSCSSAWAMHCGDDQKGCWWRASSCVTRGIDPSWKPRSRCFGGSREHHWTLCQCRGSCSERGGRRKSSPWVRPSALADRCLEVLKVLVPMSQVPSEEDEALVVFGEDVNVVPDPDQLLAVAMDFATGSSSRRATFYSADEGEAMEALPETPKAAPKSKAKEGAKPKRATTAGLADQLSSLMEIIPQMTARMDAIREEQVSMRQEFSAKHSLKPRQVPVSSMSAFAKMMGSPPRVKQQVPMPPPPKATPLTFGLDSQVSLQEQTEDGSGSARTKQGADDLGDSFAAGWRSTTRRAGILIAPHSEHEVRLEGSGCKKSWPRDRALSFCEETQTSFETPDKHRGGRLHGLLKYLERFGGYGAFKELGLIQYALAHICDALVHSDLQGAQEHLALLLVGVEQANLDGNRWDLAYRLMLLEEPPSQLWSYRSSGYDPKSKAFAPLCPQKWTTVALAYSKEIDYINTRRQEVVAAKTGGAASSGSAPGPKKKGRFPKAKANAQASQEGGQ